VKEKTRKDWWVMQPGVFEAMGRALADVENIWMGYYQRSILAGDRRLAVVSGRAGRDALDLEIANTGKFRGTDVGAQPPAALDLTGVIEATIGYRAERGILPARPDIIK